MSEIPVRTLRGEVNRAKEVFVLIPYADHDQGICPLQVSKEKAKEICDHADEAGIAEICAEVDGRKVYIGEAAGTEADEEEEEEGAAGEEVNEEEESAGRRDDLLDLLDAYPNTAALLLDLAAIVGEDFDDKKGGEMIREFATKFRPHEAELE